MRADCRVTKPSGGKGAAGICLVGWLVSPRFFSVCPGGSRARASLNYFISCRLRALTGDLDSPRPGKRSREIYPRDHRRDARPLTSRRHRRLFPGTIVQINRSLTPTYPLGPFESVCKTATHRKKLVQVYANLVDHAPTSTILRFWLTRFVTLDSGVSFSIIQIMQTGNFDDGSIDATGFRGRYHDRAR